MEQTLVAESKDVKAERELLLRLFKSIVNSNVPDADKLKKMRSFFKVYRPLFQESYEEAVARQYARWY